MAKMRVVQITHPNGPFELVEREIPEPARGQVRIKVEACGICHSQGNCTSSAVKTEELGEVGQMPASAFAFDFQRAFAGIPP